MEKNLLSESVLNLFYFLLDSVTRSVSSLNESYSYYQLVCGFNLVDSLPASGNELSVFSVDHIRTAFDDALNHTHDIVLVICHGPKCHVLDFECQKTRSKGIQRFYL